MTEDTLVIKVPLDDGSEVTYTMRGLKDEEVDDWAAFCASIFAYKANPPPASYFRRHFYNDPQRSASLIRVMIYNGISGNGQETSTPAIVASCRVFQRAISVGGGSSVRAGGIGEVCTDNGHRRRGLSKLLLQDAIRIMSERKMQLSLLHAAPAFFPVYESNGYAGTTSRWSVVAANKAKLAEVESVDGTIRLAEFPADTERLLALHQRFTERRFCGTTIRSAAYWNEYLSIELEGTLWVLTNKEGAIVAWLSIRSRGESRYQLREFGCDMESVGTGEEKAGPYYAQCFGRLLHQAAKEMIEGENDAFNFHLPTFILDDIRKESEKSTFVDWTSETGENDHGWMYRTLLSSDTAQGNMPQITETYPHLIWPADSF